MYTRISDIRIGRETVVWRGQSADKARKVSVKEPAPGLPPADLPRVINQLERESRFLEQLKHDRIVKPLQWEESGRLVFEDTQGSLDRLLEREGKLDVDLVARVLVDCLAGLAHLHERKLAHGSLCATSVLIGASCDIKLGDFVGYRVDQSHAPVAPEYLLKYKAPELLTGGAVSTDSPEVRAARIDLYALGFLGCELLAGRGNFDRMFWPGGVPPEGNANWLWWHGDAAKELPPLESILTDVPRAMIAVLKLLIGKNPATRPKYAREVAALLEDSDLLSNRKLPGLDNEDKPKPKPASVADLPAGRQVVVVKKTTLELWLGDDEIHAVRFPAKKHAVIGKLDGCRFRIPHADISDKHAMVVCQDTGHWWVYDLNSRTRFRVDGVESTAATLPDGATLELAGLPFRVRLVNGDELLPDIDKFEIVKLLHHGQGGELFLTRWRAKSRPAALRVFPANFASDIEGLRRFLERIPEAGKMRHPNLVALYRGGFVTRNEQRTWYLATEYLPGGSLRDRFTKLARPMPVDEVLRAGIDIAAALTEVADRRFVHRNVNPACILFKADGTAKLGDFFLLRDEVVQTLHQITQAAAPQGECVYQAPEVLSGTKSLTTACDVYSLAACLYEALTRQPPFNPDQGMVALYDQIQERPVDHPRKHNLAIPDRLADAIMWALEKDPDRRPKSPEAFRRELQESLTATPTKPAKPRPT